MVFPKHLGQARFFQDQEGVLNVPGPFGDHNFGRSQFQKGFGSPAHQQWVRVDLGRAQARLHQVGLQQNLLAFYFLR